MAEQDSQTPVVDTPEADAKPALEQTVTVSDSGPARKSVSVDIPESRVLAKIEERFDSLQNEAAVPGFRVGRAPLKLLEKRFGQAVRDEVKGQLISESYQAAIESEKLDVIGEPDVKDYDKIELPDSGGMSFSFEVEVAPQFELPELEGLELQKPKLEVTDESVTEELTKLQQRFGRMSEVPEEAVAADDYVTADVRVLKGTDAADDAEEILHQPGTYVWVAGESRQFKGHVAGIVVDDLGRQLAGKKVGDVLRINLTGPGGHEDDRIKDQPLTIVLRVDMIQRVQPAKLEELAEMNGMESAEDVTKYVREMLEKQRDREQQSTLREQVCDYLVENIEMDLPEGLSSRQTSRVLQRQAMDLAYRGVPQDEIEQRIAELRAGSAQQAQRGLKLFFILDKVGEKLGIEVSENEVNAQIAALAMQQNRRPEKLRQDMMRSGQVEQLFHQVLEQKALDQIISKATVIEVDEMPSSDAAEEEGGKKKRRTPTKKRSSKKKSDAGEGSDGGDAE